MEIQPDALPPLTNDEIRYALSELNLEVARIGLLTNALQGLLLAKNLVTEAEIEQAAAAVETEAKMEVQKIQDAIRRGPAGGVQ